MDTTVKPSKDHGFGVMHVNTGSGWTRLCRRCGGHLDWPCRGATNPNPVPGKRAG